MSEKVSEKKPVEVRLNIFVRLLGVIFLLVGLLMIYYTANTPLLPQISVNFYAVAVIIAAVGLTSIIVELT